jgi:hypothetical protein
MPFNISKFKSTFEGLGGPARTNLFEVTMTQPKWMQPLSEEEKGRFDARTFTMFCSAVQFPGVGINTTTYDYVGQMSKIIPSNLTNPGPITCTFLCDSDHHTMRFFHLWARHVLNYSAAGGIHSEWKGRLPHEVGFRDDYVADLEIKHYSTDSSARSYYSALLQKAYPIDVSGIALSWEGGSEYMTLDVQFVFDDYTYSADKAGHTGARSTRGAGLLDILGDIAGFADTVRGTLKSGKPRSIQDAVNKLQRIGNSLDNVTSNLPSSNNKG